MDLRGSKFRLLKRLVTGLRMRRIKEQRVDGGLYYPKGGKTRVKL
jgi:hypothetical protein